MLAAFSKLRDQIRITALSPAEGALANSLKGHGINHIPFELRERNSAKRSPESLLQEWNLAATEHDIGLFHANSLSMCRQLGRVADALAVPATGHIRDIMKLKPKAVQDLNKLTGIVTVSHATRQFHLDQGLNADICQVIYNGVDTEQFAPRERTCYLHDELGLPPNTKLAATIGQICLRKGQVDLAQSAVKIGDRFPNLHFLLIGQRHSSKAESVAYDEEIDTIFENAGMRHRLHRLGYRDDIPQLLNEVDSLIHPARQEPLGRVLLEAASSGTPIVATDVGGTSEILRASKSARLVPPGAPDQLADAIVDTLENTTESRNMAARARCFVEDRFQVENQAHALLRFWNSIMHA